jgi:hypothetical protein
MGLGSGIQGSKRHQIPDPEAGSATLASSQARLNGGPRQSSIYKMSLDVHTSLLLGLILEGWVRQ